MVALPSNARQGQSETPVQVAVRAEGPTRCPVVPALLLSASAVLLYLPASAALLYLPCYCSQVQRRCQTAVPLCVP